MWKLTFKKNNNVLQSNQKGFILKKNCVFKFSAVAEMYASIM